MFERFVQVFQDHMELAQQDGQITAEQARVTNGVLAKISSIEFINDLNNAIFMDKMDLEGGDLRDLPTGS